MTTDESLLEFFEDYVGGRVACHIRNLLGVYERELKIGDLLTAVDRAGEVDSFVTRVQGLDEHAQREARESIIKILASKDEESRHHIFLIPRCVGC